MNTPTPLTESDLTTLPEWSRVVDTVASPRGVLVEWVKFPNGLWSSSAGAGFTSAAVAVNAPILVQAGLTVDLITSTSVAAGLATKHATDDGRPIPVDVQIAATNGGKFDGPAVTLLGVTVIPTHARTDLIQSVIEAHVQEGTDCSCSAYMLSIPYSRHLAGAIRDALIGKAGTQ